LLLIQVNQSDVRMRIVTWNINGIRSLKDDWTKSLAGLNADIVCIQETKVNSKSYNRCFTYNLLTIYLLAAGENLDVPTAIVEGYTSYFGFSRKRSGYAGNSSMSI